MNWGELNALPGGIALMRCGTAQERFSSLNSVLSDER
jgi:hypothetical protein